MCFVSLMPSIIAGRREEEGSRDVLDCAKLTLESYVM